MQSAIGKKDKRQFLDVTPSVSETGDESDNVECITAVSLPSKSSKSLSEKEDISNNRH